MGSSEEFVRRLDTAKATGKVFFFPSRKVLQDIYEDYPRMVRFTDLANPRTVKAVNPSNLAATYGEGYQLREITVQMVDEPLTVGIDKRINWLESHKGTLDNYGSLHPNHPEKDFVKSAFRKGTLK